MFAHPGARATAYAVIISAFVVFVSTPVWAGIALPTSQTRTVLTHTDVDNTVPVAPIPDTDSDAAGDLNPWLIDINSSSSILTPPPAADAYGHASQDSSFAPTALSCIGASDVSVATDIVGPSEARFYSHAFATANSHCEVFFTVDEATDWSLTGLLTSDSGTSTSLVLFEADGGTTLLSAYANFDDNLDTVILNETFSLAPGHNYRLLFATTSVLAAGHDGEPGFEEDNFSQGTTGTYTGSLSLVPEPTALAPLALAALLLRAQARRRR